jgi:hypothetical protein
LKLCLILDATNMPRLTARKMKPNEIQIHQLGVGGPSHRRGAPKFINAKGVASNSPPRRHNSFRVVFIFHAHPA